MESVGVEWRPILRVESIDATMKYSLKYCFSLKALKMEQDLLDPVVVIIDLLLWDHFIFLLQSL